MSNCVGQYHQTLTPRLTYQLCLLCVAGAQVCQGAQPSSTQAATACAARSCGIRTV